jgi:hypothetical protein
VLFCSLLEVFCSQKTVFSPVESKHGRRDRLVLISGLELWRGEWAWPKSSSLGFHMSRDLMKSYFKMGTGLRPGGK